MAGEVDAVGPFIGDGQGPVAHIAGGQGSAAGVIEDEHAAGPVQGVDVFLVGGQEAVGQLVEPGVAAGGTVQTVQAEAVAGDEDVLIGDFGLDQDGGLAQEAPNQGAIYQFDCVDRGVLRADVGYTSVLADGGGDAAVELVIGPRTKYPCVLIEGYEITARSDDPDGLVAGEGGLVDVDVGVEVGPGALRHQARVFFQ